MNANAALRAEIGFCPYAGSPLFPDRGGDRAKLRVLLVGEAVERPSFILAPCDFCHARRWYSRGIIPWSMSLRDANCPCRGLSREGGRWTNSRIGRT